MIQKGDVVAGKYRVDGMLGSGGMGYVVSAVHEQLGQRVAVKLLSPNLCEDSDSITRFLREARAAVKIQSEHVARVLDVGELPDGTPFIVMEFLSGQDLAEELEEPGQLEIAEAIDYVLQASEAVAEAHVLGVVHRDLKPANLFLTRRPDGTPFVKVLDFGISKAISNEDGLLEQEPSLTATHSLLGSPAYMSPEQIRRPKSVDARTDIWSLGSILYELLTREPPFGADSPLALLAAVVSDPLPQIRDKRPEVPAALEAVIEKCLAKNPDERYQTVAELALALAPFAPSSQRSVSRISGILRAVAPPLASADHSPSSDRTLKSPLPVFPDSDAGEPKVKVVTPVSQGDKSTAIGWESAGSRASRSYKRWLAAGAAGFFVAAAVVAWQRHGAEESAVPEKPAPAPRSSAAPAVPIVPSSASAALVAEVASAVAPAPAPSVSAPAPSARPPANAMPRPVVLAPSPSAPRAKPAAPAHDPLDGRR